MKEGQAIRILHFTTLYPNREQPAHGIFVERRLLELIKTGCVRATVVAPVPWFPFSHKAFGRYGLYARIPRIEERHGLTIYHPRYPVIPKLGMNLAPHLLYRWIKPFIEGLNKKDATPFDLIDAHYFYPDGVAAVRLGKALDLPVIVTARGSDINLIADFKVPRKLIADASLNAAGVIALSESLKDKLLRLEPGIKDLLVLRNGVDLERFQPHPGNETATASSPTRKPQLLTVGNLVKGKGQKLAIEALSEIPEARLAIIGEGPERGRLEALAKSKGLLDRVSFLGSLPPDSLPAHYRKADILIHASFSEGSPNVVLESLACGTVVLASDIDAHREIITEPAAGRLFERGQGEALAKTLRALLEAPPKRSETRRFAEKFGWKATSEGQLRLFAKVLADRRTEQRVQHRR